METAYRRFLGRIESGSSVAEAFAALDIPGVRQELTDSLNALEHARHEARRAVIARGTSEGLSFGALARMWGVSRQLIARMAKEK